MQTNPPDLSSHLTTLSDGRQGIRGSLHIEISEPSTADRDTSRGAAQDQSVNQIQNLKSKIQNPDACILDFVASDETLDRYNEIVTASGWNLTNYQRNPIFQNNHQYGDIIFTLGKALITEIRDGKLVQRIQFATDVNPMAKIAYGLYRGKFLNAVSVGFVPVRWVNGDGKESCSFSSSSSNSGYGVPPSAGQNSSDLTIQRFNDSTTKKFRRKYLEQELLEVSAVGIPANPNALALAYRAGAVEKSDLRETYRLLKLTIEHCTAASKLDRTYLLSLAREFQAILKS